MKCERAQRLVLLDSAGQLSRRRRKALQKHLISCDTCRRYAADLEQISTLVRSHLAAPEAPPLSFPPPARRRQRAFSFAVSLPNFRFAVAAAAVVLLALAGTFSLYYRFHTGTPTARLIFPDEQALSRRLNRLHQEVDRVAQELAGETFYDPYSAMSLEELSEELMRMEGS